MGNVSLLRTMATLPLSSPLTPQAFFVEHHRSLPILNTELLFFPRSVPSHGLLPLAAQGVCAETANMADGGLQRLEEAMDGLWFSQNVLVPDTLQLSQETTFKEAGGSPSDKSEEKSDKHQVCRRKGPTRLNLVTSDQLFQMPPSPLTTWSRRRPSSVPPSAEDSPQSRSSSSSRRPPTRTIRSYKSSSELEQDELKGFMDLGFVFRRESLSPRMMSVIPGLQRLWKNAAGSEQPEGGEEDVRVTEKVRRPYLSEAWFINRRDSPLLNLRMLPASSTEGADMKRHLRFWARRVASTIN